MARIAVVGSGIAGLTAAYLLRREHDVVLLERDPRIGGHTHTHDVGGVPVDSGFIVHNDRTYPLLRRLFRELSITVATTEMSMSISCDGCGLTYAGGKGATGVTAQPRALLSARYLGLLRDVPRFQRLARELLAGPTDDMTTLGDWLARHRFGDYFTTHYAQPIVACVWSSGEELALQYPARYLFEFLGHHGLLSFGAAPQWYSVVGGSRRYVDRIVATLDDVRIEAAVRGIRRGARHVEIRLADDTLTVDRVVIATHADDALRMLEDPTPDERRVLGAFDYTANHAVLHADESFLPHAPRARSSWNYRMRSCSAHSSLPEVTYWMNRLQHLPGPTQHLVTLNPSVPVDEATVAARVSYSHPAYTPASVEAQQHLPGLFSETTAYAGAYHGWGFHEDGCRSGARAAEHFGVRW